MSIMKVIALEKDVAKLKKDHLHTQVTALVNDHLDTWMRETREEFMNFLSASLTDRITEQVRNQLPQILPKEVSKFAPLVIETMIIESLNQECYDGLIKSYHLDKDIFSSYDVYSLKRSREDKDKDEGSSAGLDRGLKKRKTSKYAEPTTSLKNKDSSSRSSKGTKSQPKSFGEINSLNDVVVDQMHQPWRTFAALINRGAVPPKIAIKFKKSSPSKKDSDLVPVDEEPVTKGKRIKRYVDVTRGKGIEMLSEVALTKEAQMNEVRKKSLRDFYKLHPSGSGTAAEKPPRVDKITLHVTSKGTSDKLGVPNVTKDESTDSELESWGNDEDNSNDDNGSENKGKDEENKSDDDKTPFDSKKGSDSEQDSVGSELDSEYDQQEYDDDEVKDDDDDDKFEGDEHRGIESDDVQDKKANVEMTDAQQEKENLKITQEQNQIDLAMDIPLDSVVILRYEKKSKSKNKGKVPTEMELVLEQTQQGTSYEVSVSAKGVEELKRKVKIKGEKKEALLTLRHKLGYLDIGKLNTNRRLNREDSNLLIHSYRVVCFEMLRVRDIQHLASEPRVAFCFGLHFTLEDCVLSSEDLAFFLQKILRFVFKDFAFCLGSIVFCLSQVSCVLSLKHCVLPKSRILHFVSAALRFA
nr:hypothetical protein [Tanacetum cinerariifolium]